MVMHCKKYERTQIRMCVSLFVAKHNAEATVHKWYSKVFWQFQKIPTKISTKKIRLFQGIFLNLENVFGRLLMLILQILRYAKTNHQKIQTLQYQDIFGTIQLHLQRRIQNPVEHLRRSFYGKQLIAFKR